MQMKKKIIKRMIILTLFLIAITNHCVIATTEEIIESQKQSLRNIWFFRRSK